MAVCQPRLAGSISQNNTRNADLVKDQAFLLRFPKDLSQQEVTDFARTPIGAAPRATALGNPPCSLGTARVSVTLIHVFQKNKI